MNLFVLGPHAFKDWISQMIETTSSRLTSSVPPIPLCLVNVREEADCVVRSEESLDTGFQEVWFELPRSQIGKHDFPLRLEVRALTDSSSKAQDSFSAAVAAAYREAQTRALHRVVAGPFAHDVRGALSVVSLSRQLLQAGGETRALAGKLSRVDSKVSAALLDLSARTRCLTGAWPPEEEDEDLLAPAVTSLLSWFADTHPERSCVAQESARTQAERAAPWFGVALGGVLDGVARLSRGKISIETVDGGKGSASVNLRVVGETASLHPAQRHALSTPERWSLLSSEIVPYRLATAALLITSARGTIEAEELESGLAITLASP